MKEINTAPRKGEAFPHCAAAKPQVESARTLLSLLRKLVESYMSK